MVEMDIVNWAGGISIMDSWFGLGQNRKSTKGVKLFLQSGGGTS
jgi:hypothetical protein